MCRHTDVAVLWHRSIFLVLQVLSGNRSSLCTTHCWCFLVGQNFSCHGYRLFFFFLFHRIQGEGINVDPERLPLVGTHLMNKWTYRSSCVCFWWQWNGTSISTIFVLSFTRLDRFVSDVLQGPLDRGVVFAFNIEISARLALGCWWQRTFQVEATIGTNFVARETCNSVTWHSNYD
jgi:hypothetical protein